MRKYKDEGSTKQIGNNIKLKRLEKGYSQEDIRDMTGFSVNTISAIENGKETTISYILGIAKALETHPAEVLNIDFDTTPLFNLSPKSKERIAFTKEIRKLILTTDFFNIPKRVNEVLDVLKINQSASSKCSVILNNLSKDGLLRIKKAGRNNLYLRE